MQLQITPGSPDNALFNSLIDQFEEDIIIVDVHGIILSLNKSLREAWGGAPEDFIGKTCMEVDKPEFACLNKSSFLENILAAGQRMTEDYTDVTPDGRMNHYHINAFPLYDENGAIQRVIVTRRNTTAEMQIEQRLYQSQKMAAIGELSTYIAHEIRNPLFAIGGFANALMRIPSLDDAAREKARIIVEESRRLDQILKSIINFARPTEQTIGAVDINELAVQTVEVMSFASEEKISIVLELAQNIPKIHGNAEMLKQCLINLIKNSQEAMEDGTITVRTKYLDGLVCLEVADNGPGIPQELQEEIFSPFFSTKDKGSGLGLAMTRKIINEIGGKLLLHSRVGLGTMVTLVLRPALAVSEGMPFSSGEKR